MKVTHEKRVQRIPIDRITVVNSRSRGQGKFKQIVGNIASIGLKKPITVTRRIGKDGEVRYDLVCGQGRLEAMKALGQTEVPAMVVDVEKEDALLMSLAENLARRQRTSVEMAREILAMKERGDKPAEIARKVDLDPTYVNGIIRLLTKGEERLVGAVERREIPMSTAIAIAESSDKDLQQAMADAYKSGELRGNALLVARRIIEKRRTRGKKKSGTAKSGEPVTAEALLKAYKAENARQTLLRGRARLCETRLRFVMSAMKKLLANESMIHLLRAEGLFTLPECLGQSGKAEVSNGN